MTKLHVALAAALCIVALSQPPGVTDPTCANDTFDPKISCIEIFDPVPCCLAKPADSFDGNCQASNSCVCNALGGSVSLVGGDARVPCPGGGTPEPPTHTLPTPPPPPPPPPPVTGCKGPVPKQCWLILCPANTCCGRQANGGVGCIPNKPKPKSCPCNKKLDPVCCRRKWARGTYSAPNKCVCECNGTVLPEHLCKNPGYGGGEYGGGRRWRN